MTTAQNNPEARKREAYKQLLFSSAYVLRYGGADYGEACSQHLVASNYLRRAGINIAHLIPEQEQYIKSRRESEAG